MKAALLLVLALALVPAARGASATKTIGVRGKVVSIAADGSRVAIHAGSGIVRVGCDYGSVWAPATGKVVRFTDIPCSSKSKWDLTYDGLTLGGSRAVWTDYDFGNHAYCAGPYSATLLKPKPVDLGKCPDEPDNEDLYWEYKADGDLMVARSWTLCEANCEPDYSRTYDDGVAIWLIDADGAEKLPGSLKDDTKLLDVDAGRYLLRDPSGQLQAWKLGRGKVPGVMGSAEVNLLTVNTNSAWLDGPSRISVAAGTKLTTYDAVGTVVETCTMKAGAKVQDVENGYAVYFAGTEVHLLTIATNADRVVARVKGLVQADLEPGGLFYAYNVPGGGAKPGRVAFVPR